MRAEARLVGILLLTVLLSALLVTPSVAAERERLQVGASAEGPWLDNLDAPLFADAGPLVPSDSVPQRFYLRNSSARSARATLAVVGDGSWNTLEQHLWFDTSVGGVRSRVPVAVDDVTTCATYTTGPSIPAGGVQPVDVVLRFDDVPHQSAMREQAEVDFVLTLSQIGADGTVDICGTEAIADEGPACDGPDSVVVTVAGEATCPAVEGTEATVGTLADTGAPRDAGTLALLGVVLVAGGAGLLVVRRRGQAD
ncbi:MAG: LPXTG cell wall anchor domain-containing protein [Nocardioides sp.]